MSNGVKLIGGQLLYYGNGDLVEAAKFWQSMGADIVMIKPHKYDDFFSDDFQEVNSKYRKVIETIKKMGLDVLLHPEHPKSGDVVLEPSDPTTHENLKRALLALAELIQEFNLYPEICFGPPVFAYPPYKIMGREEISEEEALENSTVFFQQLALAMKNKKIKISLETMHDPGRNFYKDGRPYKLLCYKPEHFQRLLGENSDVYTICVDTGHVKLSKASLKDYFALPYEITTLHLHSNNGQRDEHKLLTTASAIKDTLELLQLAKGPKILELKNRETPEELKLSIEAIRQNKLPEI